jgi:hypothetical protein
MVDEYGEPLVTLPTGHVVLACIDDLVGRLWADGYAIVVDPHDAAVEVWPPVPDHTWWMLESNWHDVRAVLEAHRDTDGRLSRSSGGDDAPALAARACPSMH